MRVAGFFPDLTLEVSPEYGGTEFRTQFGRKYPHIPPWTFNPTQIKGWNIEATFEVCGECESNYSQDFSAYLKIDEKVRFEQYMEFLRNHSSPVPQSSGGSNKGASPEGTLDSLPKDLPPP
jgi:hypothetical protein